MGWLLLLSVKIRNIMLERKFKDLIISFFRAELGAAEISWMVEDLQTRRDRRDLFIEAVQSYLEHEAGPGRRSSDERLRDLLVKDLTQIDERDLERAMSRRPSPLPAVETPTQAEDLEPDSELEGAEKVAEVIFERPIRKEDRSFFLPVTGVLVIIVTFVLMVRFSSLGPDAEETSDIVAEEEAARFSGTSVFRETEDFLSDSGFQVNSDKLQESSPSDGSLVRSRVSPISLADLIGGGSLASGGGDRAEKASSETEPMLILKNPQP